MNGSRDAASTLVGETFVVITPYVHAWEADPAGDYNLTTEGIMAVIRNAQTKYPIDPNRIYLQGYSAVCLLKCLEQKTDCRELQGARAIWDILPQEPTFFAAATVSAGVPIPEDFSGLPSLLNVPMQLYVGTADYEYALFFLYK